ncbi:hypothetical protein D3C87_1439640 [compost metagenome]
MYFKIGLDNAAFLLFSLSNVNDKTHDKLAVARFERAQAHFHGKLAAILAPGKQVHHMAHSTGTRGFEVLVAVAHMVFVEPLGDQCFHFPADQLAISVAKKLLCLGVKHYNVCLFVHHHDPLGRVLEQGIQHFNMPCHHLRMN